MSKSEMKRKNVMAGRPMHEGIPEGAAREEWAVARESKASQTWVCDWCGGTMRKIADSYMTSVIVKCDQCHHEAQK